MLHNHSKVTAEAIKNINKPKPETEEDKKIVNGAKLQCKVVKKDNKYYIFQFDWGNKMTFKKKISKLNQELNVGDIVEITVTSDYKKTRSVDFTNDVVKIQ